MTIAILGTKIWEVKNKVSDVSSLVTATALDTNIGEVHKNCLSY